MAKNPQNLKVVLYPEDFFDMPDNVISTKCYNVMDYKYRCNRERDQFNYPYGPFLTDGMEENRSRAFSIIFDPVFNAYGRMTSFKDGIVMHGYVVDLLESCVNDDANGDEQLEIKIRLVLNRVSYLGMDTMHELNITNE